MQEQLTENFTLIGPKNNAAIVQFSSKRTVLRPGVVRTIGNAEVQSWGTNNLLPQERERLVTDNNIIPSLLNTKRDIMVGGEIYPYKAVYEDGKKRLEEVKMPDEIAEWLDMNEWNNSILQMCSDLLMHANVFPEMILSKDGKKIARMSAKKTRHVRLERQRLDGSIRNGHWCGDWERADSREFKVQPIPFYNKGIRQKKFLLHYGDPQFSFDEYYYEPSWWGGKEWIELSNCIPQFHLGNLNNGFNIRFHIEVPADYFHKKSSRKQSTNAPADEKEQKAGINKAKQEFLDRLNNWLANPKNAGRTFISSYRINARDGKEMGGVKITPVEYDMKDEALIKLFDKSNEANMSSQGIHPTLANIQTQGKLSSGSEIRNAFLMYLAIKTPVPRRILMKPLNFVRKFNGWAKTFPEVDGFAFKDIELTKLDDHKSGTAQVVVEDGKS